jgi:hypothetical protein
MAVATAPDKPHLGAPDKHAAALRAPDLSGRRKRMIRTLRQLGAWGAAALVAAIAFIISASTPEGSKRFSAIVAKLEDPSRLFAAAGPLPPSPKDLEIQRLEAQLRSLTVDRDRMTERVAGLERSLDDVTGSIKKQASAPPAKAPDPPRMVVPILAPLSMPPQAKTDAGWTEIEPAPLAVAAATPPADDPSAPPALGVDLGSARNLDILNARWIAVKANFGPMLSGMYPLAAADVRPGFKDIRLLVGPLPNGAAAAQLCARFAAVRVTCRPTKFVGDPLALR